MNVPALSPSRIHLYLALLLGCLVATTAPAETYRILERMPTGNVVSRSADAQEPRDGVDPVTYHELFDAPTNEQHAQILWISSEKPIEVDRDTFGDSEPYPMVVFAALPSGSDLLYQLATLKDGRIIDSFTHTTDGPDWAVDQAQLAALDEGEYTLHVTIRSPGSPQTRAAQRIDIKGKGVGEPSRPVPPVVEPPVTPIDPVELTPLMEWELPSDGRIIYISSTTGNDSNNGRSPQNAVRSLDRGYALIRDGRPDWLLLKRGDEFQLADDETGDFRSWGKSGRSALEPMILGAYGSAHDALPKLHSNGLGVLKYLYISNLVIRDLHFYANQRDPDSPDFDGGSSVREFGLHMARAQNVVVQGCLFEYFNTNIMIRTDEEPEDTRLTNIRFHRCVVRNAYHLDGDDSHGMYCKHVAGIAITECIFDHNGWHADVRDSFRTGRSHNIYFSDCTQMSLERNVFSRESYLSVKFRCEIPGFCTDVNLRDNLFIGCAFPVDFDANGSDENINFVDITMQNNVFARTTGWPVDAPRNLAVRITRAENVLVDSNLFVDNGPNGSDRNEAVRASAASALRNVTISNNDAYLPTPDGDDMFSTHYRDQRDVPGVRFINNRENIPAVQYVDAGVTLERFLDATGKRNGDLDDLMGMLADSNFEAAPRITVGMIMQYYRDGFTLVR